MSADTRWAEALEMTRRVRCFMDGIDWQHELGEAPETEVYASIEAIRERKACLSGGCGIVEVEVRLVRWVEEQNLKYEDIDRSVIPAEPIENKQVVISGTNNDLTQD